MVHMCDLRTRLIELLLTMVVTVACCSMEASPALAQGCVGDCNDDGFVTVDEIVTMVNIALGTTPITACPAADPNGDETVTVDEILQAINAALNGCPPTNGCTTALITVMLDFNPNAAVPAGLTVNVDYPTEALSIPGSGVDPLVIERVTDVSGTGGFFGASDEDLDSNGTDDRVVTSAVVVGASYPPGPFEEVLFDCLEEASLPVAGDFICSLEATTAEGLPIETSLIGCSVTVGAP